MDAGRMAKGSVSIEEMGNCFLSFFFSLLSPFIWRGRGLLIKRERRDFVRSKKAFDEKESTYPAAFSGPIWCMSESMCRHNRNIWTNQTVSNISKSTFVPSHPSQNQTEEKTGYTQAPDCSNPSDCNCHVFAFLLIRSLPKEEMKRK